MPTTVAFALHRLAHMVVEELRPLLFHPHFNLEEPVKFNVVVYLNPYRVGEIDLAAEDLAGARGGSRRVPADCERFYGFKQPMGQTTTPSSGRVKAQVVVALFGFVHIITLPAITSNHSVSCGNSVRLVEAFLLG